MEGFWKGGEGPNFYLVYTIKVYMISGRRGGGGGCQNFNYLPFLPPQHF